MTRSNSPLTALSPRDRKLLLAFAFFAEAVLLYMLLVDPVLTRLGRARELAETSRRAHTELAAFVSPSATPSLQAVPEAALAPLTLEPQESPTVAIQRMLGRMASEAGVRLSEATIDPEAQELGGLISQKVAVEATGPYEAVAAFIGDMEAREPVRGIELFSLATSETDRDAVRARMTLRFFLSKP